MDQKTKPGGNMSDHAKTEKVVCSTNRSPIGVWLAIGIGIGAALGAAFDQLAMGVGLGAGLGTAIGAVVSMKCRKSSDTPTSTETI